MITDVTYFQGDTNIAQLSQVTVQEKVGIYINKYEPIYLKTVLGFALYTAFSAGLLVDPIDPKWIALRDGAEYVNRYGHSTEWTGFIDKDTSPIAAYIYYQYVRSEAKFLTGSGAVVSSTENSQRVSPIELQTLAFNSMVHKNRELVDFILSKQDSYGEYGPYCYYGYWFSNWQPNWFSNWQPNWFGYQQHKQYDKRLDFFTPVNSFNL